MLHGPKHRAGPFVKILSRCGSVLAQRRKEDFAGVVRVHVVVHHHDVFREHHLAHAPEPCMICRLGLEFLLGRAVCEGNQPRGF
jgi:hypothetical protein